MQWDRHRQTRIERREEKDSACEKKRGREEGEGRGDDRFAPVQREPTIKSHFPKVQMAERGRRGREREPC